MDNATMMAKFGQMNFGSSIDSSIMSNMTPHSSQSIMLSSNGFLNDTAAAKDPQDQTQNGSQNQQGTFWRSNSSNYPTNQYNPNSGNNTSYINNSSGYNASDSNVVPSVSSGTSQNRHYSLPAPTPEHTNTASKLTKGSSMMNINAPSYVPSYSNQVRYGSQSQPRTDLDISPTQTSSYYYNYKPNELGYVNPGDKLDYNNSTLGGYSSSNTTANTNTASNRTNTTGSSVEPIQEEYKQLKIELILKNQIVKYLTEQLNAMNKSRNKSLAETMNNQNSSSSASAKIKIPKNHYQVFQDLSKTLQEKTVELEETKGRLEALIVGLTITNGNNNRQFTNQGEFDETEISHKIINKLNLLSNENENLLQMISFGNKSSLLIELGLLRHENKTLKEKLEKYEKGK
ncbi:uncharacterized protein RJT20DRAFT_155013 [Scheffersomyces xylosifermentans]|uniref:uncharacterized protein n=1 Tax=Scheffersomyces xylosifermentans TaxID=1304137 RepID=UPI00315CAFF4